MTRTKLFFLSVFSVFISACGGGGGSSGGVNSIPPPTNSAPVALAGDDQNTEVGNLVTLNGTGTDVDNDTLSYQWTLVTQPSQSDISLSDEEQASISFTPEVAGTYQLTLIVNDGQVTSTADSITITVTESSVSSGNRPTADAGGDLPGEVGVQVVLDGSNSADPNGDVLVFSWIIVESPSGSTAELSSTDAQVVGLTPDVVGNYTVQLIVNDTVNISEASTAVITVIPANIDPVAVIGEVTDPQVNQVIALNGSESSDPDAQTGDVLQFTWSLVSIPQNSLTTLTNATSSTPTFLPDTVGEYEVSLTVVDPRQGTSSMNRTINVVRVNNAPIAKVGNALSGFVGSVFSLDGSGSTDADGDTLTYAWSVVSEPSDANTTIESPSEPITQVTLSNIGEYRFGLTVSDGELSSPLEELVVSVTTLTLNPIPIANAGDDINATLNETVILSAENSSDENNDTLTYLWSITSQPLDSIVILDQPSNVLQSITFTHVGEYIISLVVNDGTSDSIADSITVTVSDQNLPPIAEAGDNQDVNVGSLASLNGANSSDANNDSLTYSWQIISQPSGSIATLVDQNTQTPSFTPDEVGLYIIQLIVNDGQVNSLADTVTIHAVIGNVAPIANAGVDQNGRTLRLVTLDGSQSTDAEGDNLSYQWQFVSVPATSSAQLQSDTLAQSTFTPDVAGEYVLSLVVNDATANSDVDTVVVSVSDQNALPVAVIAGEFNRFTRQIITLSGSDSSDADDDELTYTWTLVSAPEGSDAILVNADAVATSFATTQAGNYIISLTVNDGLADSTPIQETITVNPHIVLERYVEGIPPSYQTIDFPMDYFATVLGFLGSAQDTYYELDKYRITAMDRNYTIDTLQFGFNTPGIVPFSFYEDESSTPMASGDVLEVGVPLTIVLGSPFTGGNIVNVVVRFSIAETGEVFTATYRYSTTL